MIRTEGLTKRYGGRVAVLDLDLDIREGELFGFLGPNGAGKSTTMWMLLGLVRPTAGKIWLLGRPITEQFLGDRRRIGVVGEHPYLYGEMETEAYLRFFADLYRASRPQARIDELLEWLSLSGHRRSRVETLSRGMRQKLSLCRALLHDPDLLLLDEPTAGLDPTGIREVRTLLQREHARGKTIFLSSHILSEIERTADRIGIISAGRLIAQGTLAEMRAVAGDAPTLEVEIAEPAQGAAACVTGLPDVLEVQANGCRLSVRFTDGHGSEQDRRLRISRALATVPATIVGMHWHKMSLEEAFVTITEANVRALAEGLDRQ